MFSKKTFIVAKREFLNVVRQKMFLLITFGIPVLFVFVGSFSVIHTLFLADEISQNISSVGIIDNANVIKTDNIEDLIDPKLLGISIFDKDKSTLKPIIKKFLNKLKIYRYNTTEDGISALKSKEISVLYSIPSNYIEVGQVKSYSRHAKIFTGGDYFLRWVLRTSLLQDRVEPIIANRVQDPVTLKHYLLDEENVIRPEDDIKFWGSLLIPYLASGIMMLTIFIPSSYLLQSVSEEKDNKIIEILLSSVSSEELLTGKMIGLGAAGLIQACVWLIFMLVPFSIGTVFFSISLLDIILYFTYIILGFLLYGSLMAGIGSLGSDTKQSAQLAGICSVISVIPLLFMPLIVLHPNGILTRILSYIPFTSSVTMMVRISTNKLDIIDVFITILILVPTIYFIIKMSARVFRTGILMYGKRLSLKEICKWIKES